MSEDIASEPDIARGDDASERKNLCSMCLKKGGNISRGRALDNVFIERLWRSLKYEDVYLRGYGELNEARDGIGKYFNFYNHHRPHQALRNQTLILLPFARHKEHRQEIMNT